VHDVAPEADVDPAGHAVHDEAPAAAANDPEVQLMHAPDPEY